MNMGPAQLLAATSYAVDLTPDSCRYHGWRVAILAYHIAEVISPDIARDVFYAGLLHDAGAVGTLHHAFDEPYIPSEAEADLIANHPLRGATLLKWLPGMERAADFVASHQECWAGGGYPYNLRGNEIPLGGQIICIADYADAAGCFNKFSRLADKLHQLAPSTGSVWSRDVFSALVTCVKSGEIYRTLTHISTRHELMQEMVETLKLSDEMNIQEGIQRALHIFPALVDIKDFSTAGHSMRTAKYAKQLAKIIGLSKEDCNQVYYAGLIHDCGRLGLPFLLMNTSGRLDDRALQLVRRHASMSMRAMSCLPDCAEMIELGRIGGHDHERYDGTGYPDQWSAEEIPALSRILSVVDAYDAMVTPRDYRLLSPRAAVLRLQQGAGKQFDPVIVDAMVSAVDSCAIQTEIAPAA